VWSVKTGGNPGSLSTLARINQQRQRTEARRKSVDDLNHLCVDKLGIGVLRGGFSREMCSFLDENRRESRVLLLAPRFSYKTLTVKGRIIQEILDNPHVTIGYVHHTLEKAIQVVNEVGELLLKSPEIRELLPEGNRPPTRGKWLKDGEFMLPGRGFGNRQPTLKAFSTGMDLTGQHFSLLIGDDLISKRAVEELKGVEYITRWWTSTAVPVIGATGRALLVGTRWSYDDLYGDALKSPLWKCLLRGILESEKHPDPQGQPIELMVLLNPDDHQGAMRPLSKDDVIRYKMPPPDGMGADFAPQMLNLPEPEGGRPWIPATHEHFVRLEDISDFIRQVIILTDPAPRGFGKYDAKSAEHDFWAISVVGYYQDAPNIMKRTLLDGCASKDWIVDNGMLQIIRLLRRWSAYNALVVGIEEPLGAAHNARFFCTKLEEMARGRQRVEAVPFRSTHRGKRARFADLFSLAETGFFTIADSCPTDYRNLFLAQVRAHPHQAEGHDDAADATAYVDDPALEDFIPKAAIARKRRLDGFDPYNLMPNEDEDAYVQRSRYFGI